MDLAQGIEIHPEVIMVKPRLKGTRILVHLVLEKLGAGETTEQALGAYPQLTNDHRIAVFRYAADLAMNEIVLAS